MPDFQTLYNQYYGALVRRAEYHYKLRDDEAEQVAIDALMDLHSAFEAGREIQNPSSLLYYQLRLHVIDVYRTVRFHRQITQALFNGAEPDPEISSLCFARLKALFKPVDSAIACEHKEFDAVDARDAVDVIWPCLTASQQRLATCIYLQGLTQRETAEKLNVPVSTLEKRIVRLRRKLRRLLSDAMAPT